MTFYSSLQGVEDGNRARRRHQLAWGIVLVIGFVAITVTNVTRVFDESDIWVTASILILLMGVHGWIAHGNDLVSPDTKGDGFYYLGLLFTFASLLFTLIDFEKSIGPESDHSDLIVNFGIALVTTIVGLAGRVLFTMTQDSPGDVTTNATQNLEAAINDMKDIVVRGGQNMEILVGHLKRSADELEKTTAGIAGSAERAESTAAALAKYSTRVVAMAEAFTASVEDFRTAVGRGGTAVSGLEERMADTQARMQGVDETLVGFGTALEGTARMLSSVEVAAAEAKTGLTGARDGAVREMIDVGALASALGKEVAGVRQEFTKMAVDCTDHARATTRSLEEQSGRVGTSAVSFARKAAGLEAELGKTGVAFSTLASTVLNAGTRMVEATSGFREVSGSAAAASEGLENAATRAQGDLAAVAEAARRMQDHLAGPGTEAANRISVAETQATRAASDLNRLTDQLAETQKTLSSITRDSESVTEQLKRTVKPRRFRLFWWRQRTRE